VLWCTGLTCLVHDCLLVVLYCCAVIRCAQAGPQDLARRFKEYVNDKPSRDATRKASEAELQRLKETGARLVTHLADGETALFVEEITRDPGMVCVHVCVCAVRTCDD
jgi:hypothetical protein